jgi:Uma2 family endonuclease
MTAAPKLRFTFDEYLLVDEGSAIKHEYLDGMILGMAGGTPEHARLAAAITISLGRQLEGKPCAVFSEALRIRVQATGFAGYPDVSVVCGPLQRDAKSPVTATNPKVVVEVMSPSTAEYDRDEKLRQYQQIDTLAHIVLVAHDAVRIDVFTRRGEGRQGAEGWTMRSFGPGSLAELAAIECTLDVDSIFRDPLAA